MCVCRGGGFDRLVLPFCFHQKKTWMKAGFRNVSMVTREGGRSAWAVVRGRDSCDLPCCGVRPRTGE